MPDQFDKLKHLLRKRIEIIADHEFRDNDPDSHLNALKEISESIEEHHHELQGENLTSIGTFFGQSKLQ
ncbi:MAG: hypothetical protein ACJ0K4_09520 [Verrucomicrobiales bacterium]